MKICCVIGVTLLVIMGSIFCLVFAVWIVCQVWAELWLAVLWARKGVIPNIKIYRGGVTYSVEYWMAIPRRGITVTPPL